MATKIGIYIPGLGEDYRKESAEKYAQRLLKQLDYNNSNSKPEYDCSIEKVKYDVKDELYTNQITIFEKLDGSKKVIYKLYEYQFSKVLTGQFDKQNVLMKSLVLFSNVLAKLPLILWRIVNTQSGVGYQTRYRGETLYIFLLFLLMSLAVIFLLPAAIGLILTAVGNNADLKNLIERIGIQPVDLKKVSQIILNFTAILLVLVPGVNVVITSLATEFTCASSYLNTGDRKQKIHGQIDRLLEFITEREGDDVELTFHSYSFGSIIILDYLFPYGIPPSSRLMKNVKGLVTIGCPYDFIYTYFPGFFDNRDVSLSPNLQWINVYSLKDALGSNFRKTATNGNAEYSVCKDAVLPNNFNYEVVNIKMTLLFQLITLYSIKAHTCYWDQEDDGQSCLRLITREMVNRKLYKK